MNIAIIAAAGQGTRLGGARAKQFLELAGVPVIIHTLKKFEQCSAIQEVYVVLPEPDVAAFPGLANRYDLRKLGRVVPGGATRAQSVWRGLESVSPAAEIVAVHDGVRPFVTPDEIELTVRAAEANGAAILTAPVVDTIKEIDDNHVARTLERARLQRALTPQCFRYELLLRAYQQSPELIDSATDDSFLVEALGQRVATVAGNPRNIKITRPEDIALGEIILKQESEQRGRTSE